MIRHMSTYEHVLFDCLSDNCVLSQFQMMLIMTIVNIMIMIVVIVGVG